MSEKRRDNKKRILRTGESQRKDGRYVYKYNDNNGKSHFVYSWKLEKTDKLPQGKRDCVSLRELEKKIQKDIMDGINPENDKMTVLQLVEKYTRQKVKVKFGTKTRYKAFINRLKKDPFGQRYISKVTPSDAVDWFLALQTKEGLSIGTVSSYRGIIRPAFRMAVKDDWLRKNPFDFKLSDYLEDDKKKRDGLPREQELAFLDFIKNDSRFYKHYDFIYILFNTGLRIAEMCGLTLDDVDMVNKTININHQLLRKPNGELYIGTPKSDSGNRILPMSQSVYECFQRAIESRKSIHIEPVIDGKTNFIFLSRRGNPTYGEMWCGQFERICKKYNKAHEIPLPHITPHICRHTYCSRMVREGVKPKTLQYLMGHSNIAITLNVYTHITSEDVLEEVERLKEAI